MRGLSMTVPCCCLFDFRLRNIYRIKEHRAMSVNRKLLLILACAINLFAWTSFAPAAKSVAVPHWYWTPAQAAVNVKRANPQHIGRSFDATTVLSAKCAGTGASKLRARARVYARFNCQVGYRDDDYGIVTSTDLYVTTSKAKRNDLGCWSKFGAAGVAKSCRP